MIASRLILARTGLFVAVLVMGGCPKQFADTEGPTISPTTGPTRGGTRVQIKGAGFTNTTKVLFGGVEAQELTLVDSTELYLTSPPGNEGVVPVQISVDGKSPGGPGYFLYSDKDADGDGLTDAQESEGWTVWPDYRGFGFGTDSFGNAAELYHVTSDPEIADTDGDGLNDFEEFQVKSDPRLADTDGDGLTDAEEVHRWGTSAISVDSDHDARGSNGDLPPDPLLYDGAELRIDPNDSTRSAGIGATSPTLADTDGDGRDDSEDNNSIFRPLIAEIPRMSIEVVDQVDIRLNVEYAEERGVTSEYSTSVATSITSGQSSTESTSEVDETATTDMSTDINHLGGHVNVTAGGEAALPPSVKVSAEIEVGVEYSHDFVEQEGTVTTVGTTRGRETTSTTEQSSSTSYTQLNADSRTKTEIVATGSLSAGVQIRNIGDVSFALNNINVAVRMWVPGQDPEDPTFSGSFRTVATLLPSFDGDLALGPGETTPIVQVSARDVNADLVRTFLANPGRLIFSSPGAQLSDANGRNFAFLREVTRARTAHLLIDFGDGRTENYTVATEVNRDSAGQPTGIRLGDVLQMLEIPFATVNQTNPPGPKVLWQLRQMPESVSDLSAQLFWSTFITRRVLTDDPPTDFEDTRLRAGDDVVIALSRDADGDRLFAAEENHFGTSDGLADTDGDGLTDLEEAMPRVTVNPNGTVTTTPPGWDVVLSTGLTYHVVSDARFTDFDKDGLNDAQEKALGTDPTKWDTDDDGLPDSFPHPLIPAGRLHVTPGGVGVSGQGTDWNTAFGTIYDALTEAQYRSITPQGDDDINEIWVAAGNYYPSRAQSYGPLNLVSNVAVYGGFSGTETKRDQRNSDPFTNGTFITGDRNGDGQPDAEDDQRLVNAVNTGPFTRLDGFTLSHANNEFTPEEPWSSYLGGAVHLQGGDLIVQNCLLTDNRAFSGAAIGAENYAGNIGAFKLTLADCTFLHNATPYGLFQSVTLSDSMPALRGIGCLNRSEVYSFNGNLVSVSSATLALDGFFRSGPGNDDYVRVTLNSGGASLTTRRRLRDLGDELHIDIPLPVDNRIGRSGSIELQFEMANCFNLPPQVEGATLTFRGVERRQGEGGAGGAVSMQGWGTAIISDCRFEGNSSKTGGALNVNTIRNFPAGDVSCSIANSVFRYNDVYAESFDQTPALGGTIAVLSAPVGHTNLHIENSRFEYNSVQGSHAASTGAAIWSSGADLSLTQCIFAQNRATSSADTVIYLTEHARHTTISSCTFASNTWNDQTPTLYWYNTNALSMRIENTIFDEFKAFDFDQATGPQPSDDALRLNPIVRYCALRLGSMSASAGFANIWGTPAAPLDIKFANPARGDYRISADSPCVDAGNNLADVNIGVGGFQFMSLLDFAGAIRRVDGDGNSRADIDIGANEYQGAP